jgi:hypothetical protein
LVSYVKNEVKNEFDNKKNVLATKEDINVVKQDLHDVKAKIIKWMFLFWIGQVAVTVGIVYTFINK